MWKRIATIAVVVVAGCSSDEAKTTSTFDREKVRAFVESNAVAGTSDSVIDGLVDDLQDTCDDDLTEQDKYTIAAMIKAGGKTLETLRLACSAETIEKAGG